MRATAWLPPERCVATILSTDASGEAERQAIAEGKRPVDSKMRLPPRRHAPAAAAGDGGGTGSSGVDARDDGMLLSWEAARVVLVRQDLKTRVLGFDVRCLLPYGHLVQAVRACIDPSVTADMSMHAPVRLRDVHGHRVDAKAASQARALQDSLRDVEIGATGGRARSDGSRGTQPHACRDATRAEGQSHRTPPNQQGSQLLADGSQPSGGKAQHSGVLRAQSPRPRGAASLQHAGASVLGRRPPPAEAGYAGGGGLSVPGGDGGTFGGGAHAYSASRDARSGGDGGADGAIGRLTYEDARFVSHAATAFLVWLARLFTAASGLIDEWVAATAACKAAEQEINSARNHAETLRAKMLVAERQEALARADEEALVKKRTQLRKLTARLPNELTTPDLLLIPQRAQPNIFFQHGAVAPDSCRLHTSALAFAQLPDEVRFYIRVKHVNAPFPLPSSVCGSRPTEQFLLTARVVEGHEEAGPVAHVPFDSDHVVGLQYHQMLSLVQLVLEVPSTPTVNPTIQPARMNFHPRHAAQLHTTAEQPRKESPFATESFVLPRVLVPIFLRPNGFHADADPFTNGARDGAVVGAGAGAGTGVGDSTNACGESAAAQGPSHAPSASLRQPSSASKPEERGHRRRSLAYETARRRLREGWVAPRLAAASAVATALDRYTSQSEAAEKLVASLSRRMARAVDLFRGWDEDGDGLVSRREFRQAMVALQLDGSVTKHDADALFDCFDGTPPLRTYAIPICQLQWPTCMRTRYTLRLPPPCA